MFSEYIQAALEHAEYDTLENGSHLVTVQGLQGVIAIGDTIEECRKDLIEVIEEWIAIRLQRGFAIPAIDGLMIDVFQGRKSWIYPNIMASSEKEIRKSLRNLRQIHINEIMLIRGSSFIA